MNRKQLHYRTRLSSIQSQPNKVVVVFVIVLVVVLVVVVVVVIVVCHRNLISEFGLNRVLRDILLL